MLGSRAYSFSVYVFENTHEQYVGPIVFLYMCLKIHMNSMHMYFRRLDYPVLWNILLHACFQVRRYLKEHTEGDSKQRLKDAQSAWMASDERAAFMGGREGIQM